jgi:hypothetical protein
MKTLGALLIIAAVAAWAAFVAILIGSYSPEWLPTAFSKLRLPKTAADLGQSLTLVDGLISSIALVLGLLAILTQMRQQADSNIIGAFSARQQFLLAECERLEIQIQQLKVSGKFDKTLFDNMVSKKQQLLKEAQQIDVRLQDLLKRI